MISNVTSEITLKAQVEFGVIPTHIKFVGGLVPDENGKLPRGDDGRLLSVAELAHLQPDISHLELPGTLQARNVAYCNNMRPPCVYRVVILTFDR